MAAGSQPLGKGSSEQTCFAWRDHGKCERKEAGTCKYGHPKSAKGKGKPDKGGGRGGNKSSSKSDASSAKGRGKGKTGDGTDLSLPNAQFRRI